MRVILADDEPLILERFAKLIMEHEQLQLVGKYTNPHDALDAILREQPDVVFLDIEMPEMNGIELADKIQSFSEEIKIVFVTAYQEYAIEAFELNAVDIPSYQALPKLLLQS